ncbi:hypothetical protein [Streptomyces sp. CT34]|uniref:hypothetical protein n=1 Tax=Streptomyces sp. CT34 TaxID=1553907 RepID=UPI0012FF2DC1|nr:hypothetical protein [Streptomyces sp. CT34]
MTVPYTPDPHHKQLLPLGVDPSTSRPITLDLDLYPHLAIAGGCGSGVSSLLRLITAHTVATGGTVNVIAPKRVCFATFEGVPGVDLTKGVDAFSAAIRSVYAEMEQRLKAGTSGPRRLLAVDDLADMIAHARYMKDTELLAAVQLLPRILLAGRAAGMHLVLGKAGRGVLNHLGSPGQVRETATALLLGKNERVLAQHMGIDPRLQRTYRGAGVLRTPGTDGRQIALAYLTDEQARAVATRPQVTG